MKPAGPPRANAALETAAGCLLFAVLALGVIELTHLAFMWTTLAESTRRVARAAAVGDFTRPLPIKDAGLFNSNGKLALGGGITRDNLQLDYLSADLSPVALPASAPQNAVNCSRRPAGADCIRYVRVSVCRAPGGATCTPLPYTPLLLPRWLLPWAMAIPTFATVRAASALGDVAGPSGSCT